MDQVDVSIIIVNWNTKGLLKACLDSIPPACEDLAYETWVVDNASSDGSPEMIRERYPDVNLIENCENLGFARANNQALRLARGRYLVLLNNDTIALPASIRHLVRFMEVHPRAAVCGPKLVKPDGSLQSSAHRFPGLILEVAKALWVDRYLPRSITGWLFLGRFWRHDKERQVDWVKAACMVVRREAFESVGGMSEQSFMYADDVEWCLRMKRAGWQVWFTPFTEIVHYGGVSAAQRWTGVEHTLVIWESDYRFFEQAFGYLWTTAFRLINIFRLGLAFIGMTFLGKIDAKDRREQRSISLKEIRYLAAHLRRE